MNAVVEFHNRGSIFLIFFKKHFQIIASWYNSQFHKQQFSFSWRFVLGWTNTEFPQSTIES